jgi:predicted dienelactone hydrolase
MTMPPIPVAILVSALALAASPPAQAADCDGPRPAGFRVLLLDSGRRVAVWYPAAAAEQPLAYSRSSGFRGSVAKDAPPAACPRVPLLLFSHGWGGCALQSLFLTESLARAGYVVVAPDHADAACAIGADAPDFSRLRIEQSFLEPGRWTDRSEVGRLNDLRAAIARVAADPQLARAADTSRVGAIGHSLGGYAALGMAGGWPTWKTPEVRAVLALSPYAAPFMAHGTLARLQVPVMYQGGTLDLVLTTSLEGPQGAYAVTAAPKFYVKLAGGTHLEWTNWQCAGQPDTAACLKARPNARLIARYATAFFDRHLKGESSEVLASSGAGLSAYRFEAK